MRSRGFAPRLSVVCESLVEGSGWPNYISRLAFQVLSQEPAQEDLRLLDSDVPKPSIGHVGLMLDFQIPLSSLLFQIE